MLGVVQLGSIGLLEWSDSVGTFQALGLRATMEYHVEMPVDCRPTWRLRTTA